MIKYKKYKPSGIEWIGDIPERWIMSKLKWVTLEHRQGYYSSNDYDESGYKMVRITDINDDNSISVDNSPFYEINDTDYLRFGLRNGDFLFPRTGGVGRFGIFNSDIPSIYGSFLIRFRFTNEIIHSFIKFYLNSSIFTNEIQKEIHGGVNQNVHVENIKDCIVIYPQSFIEQQQVVQFLNEKTELIDMLISNKERKITLLKEQRTSLINQIVTKGLNPNVKMKYSGVEWIGEIPEHWDTIPFKYEIQILTDYTSNGSFKSLSENVEYLESGYSRLVRLTDLRVNLKNQGIYISEESHNYLKKSELFGGEILISCVGYYTGIVFKMFSGMGKCSLGPNMYLIKNKVKSSNVDYLVYLLNSDIIQFGLLNGMNKTTQEKINKDNVKDLKIVRPPISEQTQIVQFLDEKTKEIDDLVLFEQKKIDLLKEYRQSLISEVVTGKIKVTTDE